MNPSLGQAIGRDLRMPVNAISGVNERSSLSARNRYAMINVTDRDIPIRLQIGQPHMMLET